MDHHEILAYIIEQLRQEPINTTLCREDTVNGERPLLCAARGYSFKSANILLKNSVNAGLTNPNTGDGVFHYLVHGYTQQHKADIAKMISLFAEHASMNIANNAGETAIHLACLLGDVELVTAFTNAGANHAYFTKCQETSLHYAVRSQSVPVVQLLLQLSIDITAAGPSGTAATLARGMKLTQIAEMIDNILVLQGLPSEILYAIFRYLNLRELFFIRAVCKRFDLLSDDDGLWKDYYHQKTGRTETLRAESFRTAYIDSCNPTTWLGDISQLHSLRQLEGSNLERTWDVCFKIRLAGDKGSGKSTFLRKVLQKESAGEIEPFTFMHEDKVVRLEIGDNCRLDPKYVRTIGTFGWQGLHGVLLFFDVTSETALSMLPLWMIELNKFTPKSCKILVANKIDQTARGDDSDLRCESARVWAQQNGLELAFISAAKNEYLGVVLKKITTLMLRQNVTKPAAEAPAGSTSTPTKAATLDLAAPIKKKKKFGLF
jgi:GTPase SAR1 family protein